ncbi:hypothetical protein HZF08_18090 [Paenibacillus sp. CGMCC 1.16610]|uniref:Uncharacterized protein n=1 Tax=Paenibacillus anseongense TaxID=2682845 RepID=A0ABW9UHA1_9BACL|nr:MULTISPECIES: hypothetical protein [Paenibacillus]MBA2940230.1 hypothetical protein [Paenibacillus sp. CGMCC 1.16610]MVQ38684.1 hypothetical protein [Paenibacillus anseongense]
MSATKHPRDWELQGVISTKCALLAAEWELGAVISSILAATQPNIVK